MVTLFNRLYGLFNQTLAFLAPAFDLLARIWVSYIFLLSGINKIETWQSTLLLFTYEYHVPLLPPYVATVMATIAEIVLPVLLTLGLGGRVMVFIFFIYNLIAMVSYPFLWTPEGQSGLYQHICWGLLLGLLMTHGLGKLSLDYWIGRKKEHSTPTHP